eukprot:TRINITY_DN10595_c0_g1_i3.p1 TRINITY_DN10595_c0_g1~~TRINITY_DN10595_c0_g1_i3.p1  ORF type:complete len:372 (-),score=91.59 TRINITY_DN10595_c0_g1_i3:93-1208(-)
MPSTHMSTRAPNMLESKPRVVKMKKEGEIDILKNIKKCQSFLKQYKEQSALIPVSNSFLCTDSMSIEEPVPTPELAVPVPTLLLSNTKEFRSHRAGLRSASIKQLGGKEAKAPARKQYKVNKACPKAKPCYKVKEKESTSESVLGKKAEAGIEFRIIALNDCNESLIFKKEEKGKSRREDSIVEFEMLEAQCNLEAELETNLMSKTLTDPNGSLNCKEESLKTGYNDLLTSFKNEKKAVKSQKHYIVKGEYKSKKDKDINTEAKERVYRIKQVGELSMRNQAEKTATLDCKEATAIKETIKDIDHGFKLKDIPDEPMNGNGDLVVAKYAYVSNARLHEDRSKRKARNTRARATSLVKMKPKEFVDDEIVAE